jgi:hypothetical protein
MSKIEHVNNVSLDKANIGQMTECFDELVVIFLIRHFVDVNKKYRVFGIPRLN